MVAQKEIATIAHVITVHVPIVTVKLLLVRIRYFASELILIKLEYDYKRGLGNLCRRCKILYFK